MVIFLQYADNKRMEIYHVPSLPDITSGSYDVKEYGTSRFFFEVAVTLFRLEENIAY